MEPDRPAPGEERNRSGQETAARPAATVIVLRDGDDGLEVLLVRRTPAARVMGGVWVFPGGVVDADEDDHRAAAVRELREETAIVVDPGVLMAYSRWITPAELVARFDTHFFLAKLPPGQEPRIDDVEIVALAWHAPTAALAAYERGELALVFPTIKHLEQLAAFATADALLDHARGREVVPVQPRIVGDDVMARIVLPADR